MHVLTNGTPLTNGEVYAILRQRRDERSAEVHPPFGLQHVQADTQSRASSHYGPAGRLLPAHAYSSDRSSTSSAEASRILLSSPSAAHLVVLLTEVRLLNYLANHAHLTTSKDSALRNIYGPSTVYAQRQQRDFILTRVELCNGDSDSVRGPGGKCCPKTSEVPVCSKRSANDSKSAGADACEPRYRANENVSNSVRRWQEVILQNRPGTPEHIQAVRQILTHYEKHGYQEEMNWAHKICRYVKTLHFASPYKALKSEPSDTNEEGCNTSNQFPLFLDASPPVGRRSENAKNTRPLLSAPRNLHTNTGAAGAASPSQQHAYPSLNSMCREGLVLKSLLLTQQELMQLVVGRPRNSFEVYRLLDNLTERFDGDEEAALRFVNFITNVFENSNEENKALEKGVKESGGT